MRRIDQAVIETFSEHMAMREQGSSLFLSIIAALSTLAVFAGFFGLIVYMFTHLNGGI